MNTLTFTEFTTVVTGIFTMVGDGIEIMMTPPVVWFVALGFGGAVIATAKAIVPRKRAK